MTSVLDTIDSYRLTKDVINTYLTEVFGAGDFRIEVSLIHR
jgi:hypothetical protein